MIGLKSNSDKSSFWVVPLTSQDPPRNRKCLWPIPPGPINDQGQTESLFELPFTSLKFLFLSLSQVKRNHNSKLMKTASIILKYTAENSKKRKKEFTGFNKKENKESIWMVTYQMGGKEPVSPTSIDFTGPHSCLFRIWLCSSTPRFTENQHTVPLRGLTQKGQARRGRA